MRSRFASIGPLTCVAMLMTTAVACAAPANDNFANARVVSGSLLREGVPGTTKAATKEAGEPEHAGDPGGASVWYSWTPLKNQVVAITTCGGFDTLLGVYTGTSVSTLTTVASNDEAGAFPGPGCGAPDSEARLAVSAGTKYMIAVDGKGGASGSVLMRIYQPPSNDNFADATSFPAGGKRHPQQLAGDERDRRARTRRQPRWRIGLVPLDRGGKRPGRSGHLWRRIGHGARRLSGNRTPQPQPRRQQRQRARGMCPRQRGELRSRGEHRLQDRC